MNTLADHLIRDLPNAGLTNDVLTCFWHNGTTDFNYLLYHRERFRDTFSVFYETWSQQRGGAKGHSLLDIGCHWLHHSMFYAQAGFAVTAADLSFVVDFPSAKVLAPQYNMKLFGYDNLIREDALSGLPDNAFDVLLFCEILEHITFNPVAMWQHIYRALKPGARIVLTTPNYYCLDGRAFDFMRLKNRMGGGLKVDDLLFVHNAGPHWKEFSVKEIQRYFALLSPDFVVSKISYRHEHYPIDRSTIKGRASAALQQRVPALRQNIHIEIDLPRKVKGITVQPGWAYPQLGPYR
jgi:2-polyprenyl-3-methyl-5-hydroxy-6-metoxy-1,4-benzoquinol methylase